MGMKYVHTNLIAKNWRTLAVFYQEVFDACLSRRRGTCPESGSTRLPGSAGHIFSGCTSAFRATETTDQPSRSFSMALCGASFRLAEYAGIYHVAFAVDHVEAAVREALTHGGSAVGTSPCERCPESGCDLSVCCRPRGEHYRDSELEEIPELKEDEL